MKKIFSFFVVIMALITPLSMLAQTGIIKGRVTNKLNNEGLPFATVQLVGSTQGAQTDENGNYEITDLKPNFYNLKCSFVGYKDLEVFEIQVVTARPTTVDFEMEEAASDLKEVVVKASAFRKTAESPVSLRNIGVSEIARSPGSNRDISQVIRSLPGVTSTPAFRNDLIIRGGSPSENRFFIDDIETPLINHFATQGASGGPAGILNVTFIKEVDFYSGAFPANRGNSLSSVFNFRQKDGRSDRWGFTATMGASDAGITAEGPLSKKTTLLMSVRQSYLQFLFKALGLPFLPTYTDAQVKLKYKPNDQNEITFLGIGANDQFSLDTSNRTNEYNAYLLDNLPISPQYSNTMGVVWKNFDKKGYWTFVASRNTLKNTAYKYFQNITTNEKTLDYYSTETEHKLRVERNEKIGNWKLNYGAGYEWVLYYNRTLQRFNNTQSFNYETDINIHKYFAFGQVSRTMVDDRLVLSVGLRADGNSYNNEMSNPLNQFSPRISLSYAITPQLSFNTNAGIFYQLPAYTALGFQQNGVLVNKDRLKFIRANHFVAGFEYNTKMDSKITIEGYFKTYQNYPFMLRDSVNLANLGSDFGVIGNAPATSDKKGRTYGIEFLFQQRLFKKFYGIFAYTFGRSEFEDKKGDYIVSSWDSRHIISATAGYQFGKNWEIGIRGRLQSGLPYTPEDLNSNIVAVWNRAGRALPDYNNLNTLRTNNIGGLDVRIDKKWYGKKTTWNLYFDIQNLLVSSITRPLMVLDRPLDSNKKPIGEAPTFTDANGLLRYQTRLLENSTGTTIPSFGVQIEF